MNLERDNPGNRDSLAITDRLAKSDPGNAGWQRDLSIAYDLVNAPPPTVTVIDGLSGDGGQPIKTKAIRTRVM